MARQTVVKKQGPRGPMTAEHKKKIGLALKRKWRTRKQDVLVHKVVQPELPLEGDSPELSLAAILMGLETAHHLTATLYEKFRKKIGA